MAHPAKYPVTGLKRKQRRDKAIEELQDPKYDEDVYREDMYDPDLTYPVSQLEVHKRRLKDKTDYKGDKYAKKRRGKVSKRKEGGLVGRNKVITGYKKGGQV